MTKQVPVETSEAPLAGSYVTFRESYTFSWKKGEDFCVFRVIKDKGGDWIFHSLIAQVHPNITPALRESILDKIVDTLKFSGWSWVS